MSTRANIRVRQSGMGWREEVQLYRHCDGYPTSVLPSLLKAFESGQAKEKDRSWQLGRAGYSAAYIIAVTYHPEAEFPNGVVSPPYVAVQPESGFDLHCDIEWLYLVNCINLSGKPIYWDVVVYQPKEGFWDEPMIKNCSVMAKGKLEDLASQSETIQRGELKTKEI